MQQTAVNVQEIAFVGYPVTDMKRARQFYETVLGLRPSHVTPDGNWVEYDISNGTFLIGCYSEWQPSLSGPSAALEVEDFDQTIQTLRDQGIKILMEPMDTGVCRMCQIQDTEGNALMIHRRK